MTDDTIQVLLDAIAQGDDETAERAAMACEGRDDLLPALRPLLADDDADRRWWAVRTLALIGGEGAAELASQHLLDPDVPTRCAAALALGKLQALDAIPSLVLALADESGWVRDSAGDALVLMGEPALVPVTQAAADPRDGVRVRAASALRRLVVPPLQGKRTTQYPPQYLPALTVLFERLNDPNGVVRQHAHEALDRLGLLDTLFFAP